MASKPRARPTSGPRKPMKLTKDGRLPFDATSYGDANPGTS